MFNVNLVMNTVRIDMLNPKAAELLISLAVDGKADYLLTGDNDLLALNPFKDPHIVTFSAFLEKIK